MSQDGRFSVNYETILVAEEGWVRTITAESAGAAECDDAADAG